MTNESKQVQSMNRQRHAPDEPEPDLSLNILREANRDDSLLCMATLSSESWFWWDICVGVIGKKYAVSEVVSSECLLKLG